MLVAGAAVTLSSVIKLLSLKGKRSQCNAPLDSQDNSGLPFRGNPDYVRAIFRH